MIACDFDVFDLTETTGKDTDPNDPRLSGAIWLRFHCIHMGTDKERIQMDSLF